VREIERRIQLTESRNAASVTAVAAPVGIPEAFDDHAALMFDLLAVAWQADLTRVFTYMTAREASMRTFPALGISEAHHDISHHGNAAAKMAQHATITTHFAALFARFVERLKAAPDGDGSVLDHSMVLFGSGMGNANDHTHHPLPTVILGGGGGRMRKLGHHISQPDVPIANMLLAMAQKTGVEIERFGESTEPLDI
jgi:hypothetical protein